MFTIQQTGVRTYAKSAAIDTKYTVKLNEAWHGTKLVDMYQTIHDLFKDILDSIGGEPNDKIRFILKHPDLSNPMVVPIRTVKDITSNDILDVIEKTLTSHQDLSVTDDMELVVGHIHIPSGSGRKYVTNLSRDLHSKHSVIQIKNDDTMCAARAIAVAYTKSCIAEDEDYRETNVKMDSLEKLFTTGKASRSFYKDVCRGEKGKRREQFKMARLLCLKAEISQYEPCSLDELSKFEHVINRNICVLSAEMGNKFVRKPNHRDKDNLYLYLHEGHYDAIVSMTGFFNARYFCEDCLMPYYHKGKHVCETHCQVCASQNCINQGIPLECPDCHQLCRNQACLDLHAKIPFKHSNRCAGFYRCTRCNKVMSSERKDKHQCGEWHCSLCNSWVLNDHLCYIRTEEHKQSEPRFIFYDIETTQEDVIQCSLGYTANKPEGCDTCTTDQLCNTCRKCINCNESICGRVKHVANLIVAQTVCPRCFDSNDTLCTECGLRCPNCKEQSCVNCPSTKEMVFYNTDEFCKWLISPQYQYFTCIAHNAKAFDSYFVLDYLSKQGIRPNNCIFNGTKLMYLEVQKGLNIRFLDSLNFLPMKLSALPKAFGLKELRKGYFPHLFNKKRNWSYPGPYPGPSYYGADNMSCDEREKFLEWHHNQQGKVFKLQQELLEYCQSDVDILKKACLQYRQLMLEATSVDPFQSVTVASVAMKVFKTNFLYENWKVQLENGEWHEAIYKGGQWQVKIGEDYVQGLEIKNKEFVSTPIAQIPANGYVTNVSFSKESIQWLEWVSHQQQIKILHALNGDGERKIGPYYVDGLYEKTVFEFNGCFWHGCPTCYPIDRTKVKNPRTQQSMNELYTLTEKKRKYIEKCGYTVVSKWEHEFKQDIKTNMDMQTFVEELDIVDRLDPRDSFFGGRTNALKLHHIVEDPDEIRYVDFTSLYPFVNKYKEYPVGHIKIITGNFDNLHNYFGIAKVNILPPRGLYLPVLPYRSNGKLKFTLCKTCADQESKDMCTCTDVNRALTGTWCIPEILKAIEKGYELKKIYEVYHFEKTSKYDKDGGLFSEYVDTFLRYKQEASDWPEWCDTPEKKAQYVNEYLRNEGVLLNKENIKKNPGLRSLAKIKLNSFWGKFGQRKNFVKSKYFGSEDLPEFHQLISDSTKTLKNFNIINDQLILVEYVDGSYQVEDDKLTNMFLATFTTCWARLHLYDVMDTLNDRVLYHDTDSIIYIHEDNKPNPCLGDYLGQLTDELNGDSIKEFVSAGPKNYGYVTKLGKTVCKVRGFRLNFKNSKLINFNFMKEIVTRDREREITTSETKISRNKYNNQLYNKIEEKQYKLVYDKRMLDPLSSWTIPYGY